jgi:hypothetical protein
MLTVSISTTQIQPIVRCGIVPLGALNCTTPSTNAVIAANAWSWIAGVACNNGARVIGP